MSEEIDFAEAMRAAQEAQEAQAREAAEEAARAEAEAEANARVAAKETVAAMASAQMAALQAEAESENAERDALAASLAAMLAANAAAIPEPIVSLDRVDAPRGSFGPTFWDELALAGAAALPFIASVDHVIFGADISAEDRARVLAVIEAHDPSKTPAVPELVVVVSSVDFYRRMTVGEADQVEGVIAQQSARDRRIFEKANTFRSDAPEWPTLVGLATQLFGKDRAAEILAPSEV